MLLTMSITLLFILIIGRPLYPSEIYKWVDENGVLSFTDNLESVPKMYRVQIKKENWSEEGNMDSIKENQTQKGEQVGWRLEAGECKLYSNDFNDNDNVKSMELRAKRNYHSAKVREKYTHEKNFGKAWLIYYRNYLTDDQRKRIPLFFKHAK